MSRYSLTLPLFLILFPALTTAQDLPDTSDWECSFCEFPAGLFLEVDTGAGFVTDDAYRFGSYRGFDDDGAIFIGDFELDFWSGNGGYWRASGSDLGLDSRSVEVEGGRQGLYTLNLFYNNLPKQLFGTTMTPFSGFDTLSLPSGWVTSGSTATMTALGASLMPIEIGHERETVGLGITFHPSSKLQYKIDYRHDERDGNRIHAGNFLTQSVLLPEPLDYSTDQVDASIVYAGSRGQLGLNYYASLFNNKSQALTWDNPFTPIFTGATQGRIALPPDNQAHQLSLNGALRLTATARLSAVVAIGSLDQDDLFIPATINPALAGTPLPATNLDGRVKTRKYNLRLSARPMAKLRVTAELDEDDRINQTPRNVYSIVESDVISSGLRRNVPYSFQRTRVSLKGDYRLDRRITLSSGYRYREIERDFQEVFETEEHSTWFGARYRPRDDNKLSSAEIKFGHDERDGGNYIMVNDPATMQNPLLRKYNLADRDRDFVRAAVALTPAERLDLGLSLETADEDYESTTLGLLNSDSERFNLDGSVRLSDNAFLTMFVGRETIDSDQTGSSTFGSPDWLATVGDEIDTFGLGLRLLEINNKIDVTLDYFFSEATGRIAVSRPISGPADNFPDLITRLHSARLYADYRPNDRYEVRLGYYYEQLQSRDWALAGIAPATLPTLLSLGAQSPDYTGGIFSLSFRYSLANASSEAP